GSQNNVIRLDLANVLPVPAADTRIADILDFKERRSDELAALHASLDAVYLEIIKSPDVDLSKHMEIKKFLESISALNKLHNEHFKIFKNFDFSAEFNISG